MIMNALPLIWGGVWQISLYYDEKINYVLIINARQGIEGRTLPKPGLCLALSHVSEPLTLVSPSSRALLTTKKGGILCFEEEILHNMGSFNN
jgi:hypothetical protein